MRIPSDMPIRGWTTDASYASVPAGMSLDMLNVIPHDQHQGRMRMATRPSLSTVDIFGEAGNPNYEVQCIVSCANYALNPSAARVRVDRILIVSNGDLYQVLPGNAPVQVTTGQPFVTSGPVSGIQFREYAYFVDGTNYVKVSLGTQVLVSGDVTDWATGCPGTPVGPCSVETAAGDRATLIVRYGARVALAGVHGSDENWWLSAIDDADSWVPTTTATDAVAGGQGSEYGTIGEPIQAIIPFGVSGLLLAGKSSISYLTSDPAFSGATMQVMTRSMGLVSPRAWCPGPSQSVFVLSEEGLLLLNPNQYEVDKSAVVSRNRLDAFFEHRDWDDMDVVLVHDVSRSGIWIWMNDLSAPLRSTHLFYSYSTDGFFPCKFRHPDFAGARVGIHTTIDSSGRQSVLLGSDRGVLATIDPAIVAGSDGQKASMVSWSTFTNGDSSTLSSEDIFENRIESHVSVGPLVGPHPNQILIREVTVESGMDPYLPNSANEGVTNKPRVHLLYGDSAQEAIGNNTASISVLLSEELIVDCGYNDNDTPDVTIDGGEQDGSGGGGYIEGRDTYGAGGVVVPATDASAIDGALSSRVWSNSNWVSEDTFTEPSQMRYEPTTDNGFYMVRGVWDSQDRWLIKDGSNTVNYVQQAEYGQYPVDLEDQVFHGAARTGSTAGGEFGSFDSDLTDDDQWDDLVDIVGYPLHRRDIIQTNAAVFEDQTALDLGCLDEGRGNRRRCRVRTLVAFVRISGRKEDQSHGYPFTLEGLTVEADVVNLRKSVYTPDCEGDLAPNIGPDEDPTLPETLIRPCCVDGVCTMTTESACTGVWHENSSDCDSISCGSSGACCYLDATGFNCDEMTQADCASLPDSQYFGPGTTCIEDATACVLGKCCFDCDAPHDEFGECADMFQVDCNSAGGVFTPGVLCGSDENPCCVPPAATAACCDDNYNCVMATYEDCNEAGHTWYEDDTCDDSPCVAGRCCHRQYPLPSSPFECHRLPQEDCEAYNTDDDGYEAVWDGEGTDCTDDCPVGGCCMPLGYCEYHSSESNCVAAGGEWTGDDLCEDGLCDRGRCCHGEDECTDDVTEAACDAFAGPSNWLSKTTCASVPCPTGCCCHSDGCDETYQDWCEDELSGTWTPVGDDCNTTTCEAATTIGACCSTTGDGGCVQTVEYCCDTATNVWSAGTCGGDVGACCHGVWGEECTVTTETCCTAMGGDFSSCDTCSDVCPCLGKCCYEDEFGVHCVAASQERCESSAAGGYDGIYTPPCNNCPEDSSDCEGCSSGGQWDWACGGEAPCYAPPDNDDCCACADWCLCCAGDDTCLGVMTTEACEAIAGAGCDNSVIVNCAGDFEVVDEDLATCVAEDGACAQIWYVCTDGGECLHRGPYDACGGIPSLGAWCAAENVTITCDDPCSGGTPCEDCP